MPKEKTTTTPDDFVQDPADFGWEGTRQRQLTAGLAATPAQRLAWLEDAIRLAHRTGALPRRSARDKHATADDER